MEDRAPSGSRPLHRPPPPSATFVRRLRAGGVGAVALLAWAVVVPGFAPAGALAAGGPPGVAGVTSTSAPSAAEAGGPQIQARQRGRGGRAAGAPRGRAPPPPRPPGWSRPAAVPPSRPSPFVLTARPRPGRPG